MQLFRRPLVLAILAVSSLVWPVVCAQPSPVFTSVANAEGGSPAIAPNCAPGYCWQASDFMNNQLPVRLHGVSVTVNGNAAYIYYYYISPTQVTIQPRDGLLSQEALTEYGDSHGSGFSGGLGAEFLWDHSAGER
jgi:hypothetical protein